MHIFVENINIRIIVYLPTWLVYLNIINRVYVASYKKRHVPIYIHIVYFCKSVIHLGILGHRESLTPKNVEGGIAPK